MLIPLKSNNTLFSKIWRKKNLVFCFFWFFFITGTLSSSRKELSIFSTYSRFFFSRMGIRRTFSQIQSAFHGHYSRFFHGDLRSFTDRKLKIFTEGKLFFRKKKHCLKDLFLGLFSALKVDKWTQTIRFLVKSWATFENLEADF